MYNKKIKPLSTSIRQQVLESIIIAPEFLPSDYSWAKPEDHSGPYLKLSTKKDPIGSYALSLNLSPHVSIGIYTSQQMSHFLDDNSELDQTCLLQMAAGIADVLADHLSPASGSLKVQAEFPRDNNYWSPLVDQLNNYLDTQRSASNTIIKVHRNNLFHLPKQRLYTILL